MYSVGRRGLLQHALLVAGASAMPQAAAGTLFQGVAPLPADTFKLLTAVADTMIPQTDTPGAVAAGVPVALGKMLADWASPAQRTLLLEAMQAVDARAGGSGSFAALTPAARYELLNAHDKASAADPGYAKLKDLLVTLYYLSEQGATVELRYEHSPGAWEPSIPVTAETRNYGGPANI